MVEIVVRLAAERLFQTDLTNFKIGSLRILEAIDVTDPRRLGPTRNVAKQAVDPLELHVIQPQDSRGVEPRPDIGFDDFLIRELGRDHKGLVEFEPLRIAVCRTRGPDSQVIPHHGLVIRGDRERIFEREPE